MKGSDQSLADAIADAATTMPDGHLRTLAIRIEGYAHPADAWGITREPPVREYIHAANRILKAWERLPDAVHGVAIATALRAAAATRTKMVTEQQVSLVWTGPDTSHIQALPTSDVVIDIIKSAQRDLLLVSYATFREPRIHEALVYAVARGVNINLLVENAEAAEGQYMAAVRDPFDGISATRYEWANDQRPRVGDRPAVMHAKIVLADDHTAFISSANLTGRALDHNMEAGVLIAGGPIPRILFDHFRELAYNRVIEKV